MKKSQLTFLVLITASLALACTAKTSDTTTTGTTTTATDQECTDQCIRKVRMDSVGPVIDTMRIGPTDTAFVVGYGFVRGPGGTRDLPALPNRLMIIRR
jgi:hypothetical protein